MAILLPAGVAAQDITSMTLPKSPEAAAALADRMLELKTGPMATVGTALAELHRQHEAFESRALRRTGLAFAPSNPMIRMIDGKVVIDAVAARDTAALLEDLQALGLTHGASFGRVVSGRLPVAALDEAAALTSLRFARPALALSRVGLVTSEGDPAMNADLAREEEEVRGRRVTVGVLSDSYDCLGDAATDIGTGDLPPAHRIAILDDSACPGSDEGRAMMQLIRDVAPGARQAFHTAFGGQANFALGIIELASQARADVIVDDVIYLAEPMFQDGIIAQAVDQVKAMGVAYFSSAGNNGRNSWDSGEEGFVSSGIPGFFPGSIRHDFDPGPGIDDLQTLSLGPGDTSLVLQWDEPFASVGGAGAQNDVDIILYTAQGIPFAGSFADNINGDPIEGFTITNDGNQPIEIQIGIELFAGPPPGFMKYVIFDPRSENINDPPTSFPVDFPTHSSTNYGHSNAAGAAGVGASFWRQTPRFGVFPPRINAFSSAGGTPILFDTDGLPVNELRAQPRVTGPDGGITTFFGSRDEFGNIDPDGTNFFGTSAAAPHVAAVAALMLEANRRLAPDIVYWILEETAIDMDDPATPDFDVGFDFGTGFGLVDAEEAVDEAEDFDDDYDHSIALK